MKTSEWSKVMVSNEFLRKQTEKALEEMSIRVYCQTCGKVFLEISCTEYIALSSHFKEGSPDKWFVETGIHWVENDGHVILMDLMNALEAVVQQEDISLIWDLKLEEDRKINPQASKELQRPHFYKYREKCKNKPI